MTHLADHWRQSEGDGVVEVFLRLVAAPVEHGEHGAVALQQEAVQAVGQRAGEDELHTRRRRDVHPARLQSGEGGRPTPATYVVSLRVAWPDKRPSGFVGLWV